MEIRTFVALPLDEAVRDRLAAAREALAAAAPAVRVRWVARANLHLTVKFLGGVDERLLAEVCRAAGEVAAAGGPFEFRVRGLAPVPARGPLRMIWAGIEEATGRLTELAERLERTFREMGYKEERRAFHPHLTLGRVKSPRGADALRDAARARAETDFGLQPAEEIVVFSSELTRDGPVYTAVARAPLGG